MKHETKYNIMREKVIDKLEKYTEKGGFDTGVITRDDFINLADELVKLFAIPDVVNCNHDFQRVVRGGEFQGNQCTICEKWEDLT